MKAKKKAQGFVSLDLPFPPSVNRLWRVVKGRPKVSAVGLLYRKKVQIAVLKQCNFRPPRLAGKLTVDILANRPDKRVERDLDNLLKALFDSLESAHVFLSDSQVWDIRIRWADEIVKGGKVLVNLFEEEA